MPELKKIPLGMIDEPALPIREAMDETKLAELMESIRELGLLQPIGVWPSGERYEIEFGHRRFMACRQLGRFDINALVFTPEEIAKGAAMLAENVFREDLTTAEEAIWFAELMEKHGVDTDGVAAMVRKGRDYVEDRLRLMRGDLKVFDALRERKINFTVARELNKCRDESLRPMFLHQAIVGEVGAKTVAAWVTNSARENLPSPLPASAADGALPPSVVPENKITCELCKGDRDPYNMALVHMHHYCRMALEKILENAGVKAG